MTPEQTLTAAANKLRQAATEAVHEDRTTWRRGNTLGTKSKVVLDDPERPSVLIETYAARLERVNAYLELVGPATGLTAGDDHGEHNPYALAVARQILGEDQT